MDQLNNEEKKQLAKVKRQQPGLFKRLMHGMVMALAVQGTAQGVGQRENLYPNGDPFMNYAYADMSGQANDMRPAPTGPSGALPGRPPIGVQPAIAAPSMGGKRRRTKKGKRKHKKRTMKRKKKNSKRRRKKKTSKRR